MKATASQILEKYASYIEAMMEREKALTIDAATVAAAILTVIEVVPAVTITRFSDDKDS